MEGIVLVQEQGGNITYNITGFRRIEIRDDASEMRLVNADAPDLYSIRAFFGTEGSGESGIVLGRYMAYQDAVAYYSDLILKIAAGDSFISMVPGKDRELPER